MGVIAVLKKPLQTYAKKVGTASTELEGLGAYKGPFAAPIEERQTEALGGLTNIARARNLNNPGDQVVNLAQSYLNPNYLNLENDPTFNAALRAMANPLNESRADQLNRSRAVAAGSGAELSDRAFVNEGNINTGVDRVLSDQVARAAMDEMARRQGIQTQVAPQMLAGGLGLQETPSRLLGEVGGAQRQLIQETQVEPQRLGFEESLQAALRPTVPYQNMFGVTGVPQKPVGGSSGGGGVGGILQGVLGLGGLGMASGLLGGK